MVYYVVYYVVTSERPALGGVDSAGTVTAYHIWTHNPRFPSLRSIHSHAGMVTYKATVKQHLRNELRDAKAKEKRRLQVSESRCGTLSPCRAGGCHVIMPRHHATSSALSI